MIVVFDRAYYEQAVSNLKRNIKLTRNTNWSQADKDLLIAIYSKKLQEYNDKLEQLNDLSLQPVQFTQPTL